MSHPALVPETPLDFGVRVNRGPLRYPNWVQGLRHPELHAAGPAEYDLSTGVAGWVAKEQERRGGIKAGAVYERFVQADLLLPSLSLADLLAIQAKGLEVFLALYAGKSVLAWRSMARGHGGCWRIPCLELEEEDGELLLKWVSLRQELTMRHPALLFK